VNRGLFDGTAVGAARYAPGMAFFVLTMVDGPRYARARARREQDGWDEHAAFMDGLAEAGFVVLGGPIGDGEQVMVVVEAADEVEVRARFAGDPWGPMGILAIGEIRPWTIWLDGRAVSAGPGQGSGAVPGAGAGQGPGAGQGAGAVGRG
jgi:uncharacterized protein YciI